MRGSATRLVAEPVHMRQRFGHSAQVTQTVWCSPPPSAPASASAHVQLLASCSLDGKVKVWDADAGRVLCSYRHESPIISMDWQPAAPRSVSKSAQAPDALLLGRLVVVAPVSASRADVFVGGSKGAAAKPLQCG